MTVCACGCGERPATGIFRPGHDSKLRADAERRAGGVIRLARLVDAAEAYARGETALETFGEKVRSQFAALDQTGKPNRVTGRR